MAWVAFHPVSPQPAQASHSPVISSFTSILSTHLSNLSRAVQEEAMLSVYVCLVNLSGSLCEFYQLAFYQHCPMA